MEDGPAPKPRSATAASGTASPSVPGTGSTSSAARLGRAAGSSCTRIGISRSPSRNLARLAGMSPMVAMRTASAIASVDTPNRLASSLRGTTRISGRSTPALAATSRKPGRRRIAPSSRATAGVQRHRLVAQHGHRQLPLAAVVHQPAMQVRDAGEVAGQRLLDRLLAAAALALGHQRHHDGGGADGRAGPGGGGAAHHEHGGHAGLGQELRAPPRPSSRACRPAWRRAAAPATARCGCRPAAG